MTKLPYDTPPASKGDLLTRLQEILQGGWFDTRDQDADGKVGNTLEDLIGVKENNFSLPDVGEYELKTKRRKTGSLTSLIHYDPFPRKNYPGCSRRCSPVQGFLVPEFGWPHEGYENENSFRVTLSGQDWQPRGFRINVGHEDKRIYIEFKKDKVRPSDLRTGNPEEWKSGLPSKLPQTIYWEFGDLEQKLRDKLPNMIFVYADARGQGEDEEFNYTEAEIWEGFNFDKFVEEIESGGVKIDFDARTGHNHGVKFRIDKSSGTSMDGFYEKKYQIDENTNVSDMGGEGEYGTV